MAELDPLVPRKQSVHGDSFFQHLFRRISLLGSTNDIDNAQPQFGYQTNEDYLSTSAFNTIGEEVIRQKAVLTRRKSDSIDSYSTPSEDLESTGRDALYAALPFVATNGMQNREKNVKKVLSKLSSNALDALELRTGKDQRHKILASIDVDDIALTTPLLMAVLVAVLAQFLVGYNTSVMNASAALVFPGHTTSEWSVAVAAFAVGGPVGAMVGGRLADNQGRRRAMLICTWVFLAGGLIMTGAPSLRFLTLARLIIGFASGLSTVVVPVYLGEIAPPTLRGTLGTFTQFAIVIGILVSEVLAFPFATPSGWRILFAVTPCICALQLFISPFLLESPRWLLSRDPESMTARIVVKQLRAYRSDIEVEDEIGHFTYAYKRSEENSANGSIAELLRTKHLHGLLQAVLLLQMGQQLCGINAVFYYSTSFFDGVIDDPLLGSTLVALVNVIATYVALKLMDITARRTLLLWSTGGMVISTVFIILALLKYMHNFVALLAVMAFVSFFEIGLGPIPWLIVAEMFDAKFVATAMSLASILNWGCNFLVGLMFPYMQSALGPWSFAPFGVVLIFIFAYTYLQLPETQGKTVEEIQRLFAINDEEVLNAVTYVEAIDGYDLDDIPE